MWPSDCFHDTPGGLHPGPSRGDLAESLLEPNTWSGCGTSAFKLFSGSQTRSASNHSRRPSTWSQGRAGLGKAAQAGLLALS